MTFRGGADLAQDKVPRLLYDRCPMSTDIPTDLPQYQSVLSLLTRLDPYGLEPGTPGGPPQDEYSAEAGSMTEHLLNKGSIGIADVDAIWSYWFSQTLTDAAGPDAARRLTDELNALTDTSCRRE